MHRKVDAIATKWEPKFAKAAARALWHDKRELVKRMQTKAEVEWTVIGRKWDEYFERFADESWREEFMPLIEGLVTEQGESWNTTLGMQFDVRNYLAEAWLDDYMLVFAQDINNTTKQDTSSILLDAMQQGWGIDRMNKGLGLLFDKYINDKKVDCSRDDLSPEEQWFCDRQPKYRRENISRTETMRSSNAGSQALFGAMGAQKHEWWGTGDDRLRDSHLVAWMKYSEGGNPGPIPIGQPFEVGSSRLMQPGDPGGAPEDVIQCRCTVLPYMDTWAGTEEEIAAARADMDAEVARREVERRPEWKPTMTQEEARTWATESKIKEAQYHGTSVRAAEAIKSDGFSLDFAGAGRVFGEGIYMTTDSIYASAYADRAQVGEVLQLAINIQNPYYAPSGKGIDLIDMGLSDTSKHVPFVSFAERVARELGLPKSEIAKAATEWMQQKGYDAYVGMEFGIDWSARHPMINVFDSKNIVVIKE